MQQFLNFLTSLCLATFITGCGGGGSDSATAPPTTTTTPGTNTPTTKPDDEAFFQPALTLPSSAGYIPDDCAGGERHFNIPVNINDDEYMDFVAQFWCESETGTGAVPNVLVAFVSFADGQYVIDNTTVFGEEYPALSGSIGGQATADINGDGKLDIALSVINEDGRTTTGEDGELNNSGTPTVLMSTDTGFEIVQIGVPEWGGPVVIRDNVIHFAGTRMCNIEPFLCHQTYSYDGENFVDVTADYPRLSNYDFTYLDDDTILVSDFYDSDAEIGYDFGVIKYQRDDQGWHAVDHVSYGTLSEIQYLTWNEQMSGSNQYTTRMMLTTPDGEQVLGIHSTEVQTVSVDGQAKVLVALAGEINPNEQIQPGAQVVEGDQGQLLYNRVIILDADTLQTSDTNIVDQQINLNGSMQLVDVNSDGYQDLVLNTITPVNYMDQDPVLYGLPYIYLMDPEQNSFVYANTDVLDINDNPNLGMYDVASFVGDFNADGLQDIISVTVYNNDYNTYGDQIYLANRAMFEEQ